MCLYNFLFCRKRNDKTFYRIKNDKKKNNNDKITKNKNYFDYQEIKEVDILYDKEKNNRFIRKMEKILSNF